MAFSLGRELWFRSSTVEYLALNQGIRVRLPAGLFAGAVSAAAFAAVLLQLLVVLVSATDATAIRKDEGITSAFLFLLAIAIIVAFEDEAEFVVRVTAFVAATATAHKLPRLLIYIMSGV